MYLSGDEDLSRYGHEVLRINSKSGETSIMDLTNAQFGKCGNPVIATTIYMQKHVRYIEKAYPFGWQRQFAAGEVKQRGWRGVMYAMLEQVHDHLKSTVEEWEKGHKLLGTMMKISETEFQRDQAEFIEHITKELHQFKEAGDAKGWWRAPEGTLANGKPIVVIWIVGWPPKRACDDAVRGQ